jgi:hypothetical protein
MRCDDKGMALVSVVLMLTVLLAMAQVLVEKVWQSTRQGVAADRREFLFWAAQSGLESARKRLAENYLSSSGWQSLLSAGGAREYPVTPVWADISNGQQVEIYLRDNEDGDGDFRRDNDLKIYVLVRARGNAGGEVLLESLCGFEAATGTGTSTNTTVAESFADLVGQQDGSLDIMD